MTTGFSNVEDSDLDRRSFSGVVGADACQKGKRQTGDSECGKLL